MSPSRSGGHPPQREVGRRETFEEKQDRNWNDVLQELRVVQTGVQVLSGFLLTLPFTSRFSDLDDAQRWLYLGLVVTAALAVGVTLTPIMVHRRVFGQRIKVQVVRVGHVLAQVMIVLLGLLIVGICMLIFSVVVSWTAALVVGAVFVIVLTGLLVLVPWKVARTTR